jgi:hypothetical protein
MACVAGPDGAHDNHRDEIGRLPFVNAQPARGGTAAAAIVDRS